MLLVHIPDTVERIQNSVFDLILAGHSHGGQVSFPLVGPLFRTPGAEKYVHGLYQTHAGPLHVTAGLGWFLIPIRFNCPPEIAVIEL